MEDSSQKIVVFASYDNVVMANLAKTKLDAYGIPCFLSDENFTSLYPIQNEIFPGARLHIFEEDREQVHDILGDVMAPLKPTSCPKCKSTDISLESVTKEGFGPAMVRIAVACFAMMGIKMGAPESLRFTRYYCHVCGNKFD